MGATSVRYPEQSVKSGSRPQNDHTISDLKCCDKNHAKRYTLFERSEILGHINANEECKTTDCPFFS